MKIPPIALAALCLFACTNATGSTAEAAAGWSDYMSGLEGTMEFLEQELTSTPRGELTAIAERAEQAAAGMSKGYGEQELPGIPGFAKYARDAEAWLLQIAVEARQGRGELAAEAFRVGVAKHCNDCHDAEAKSGR